MKNRYKKAISFALVAVLFVGTMLTGCGNRNGESSGTSKLSRSQYIGMLGDIFGCDSYVTETDIFSDVSSSDENYAAIQAAAEWDIVDSDDAFRPSEDATLAFALESAVRALGVDELSSTEGDIADYAEYYVSNIAALDTSDLEASLSDETAGQILEYAYDYKSTMQRPQVTELQLADGVKEATPDVHLNEDGQTGELGDSNQNQYQVGDIVYFDATDSSLAKALKVTSIDGTDITFEDATIEEAYSQINVSGTFTGVVVDATPASDQTAVTSAEDIYNEMNAYGMKLNPMEQHYAVTLANGVKKNLSKGADYIMFTASASGSDDHASANASFNIGIKNIRADVDYKTPLFKPLSPEKVSFNLYFDTEISGHVDGSIASTIPLGEAYIQVWGPLNIRVALTANIGADGSVDVSYTTVNSLTSGWKKGCGFKKSFKSTPTATYEAEATITAEASVLCDLRVGINKISESVANAQVTTGVVAVAKREIDLLGKQPDCTDVLIYVPLRYGINQEGCILTWISDSFKTSKTIWDSTNSPIQLHIHFEDGERTAGDVCTRGDAVEQENVDEEEEPIDELELFTFEPIEFDFIDIDSYVMYLQPGESKAIGFVRIPDDYSASELIYTVKDTSVCSVSSGTVTGNRAGSTLVIISTPDEMFKAALSVTVNDDYSIEGGFQGL